MRSGGLLVGLLGDYIEGWDSDTSGLVAGLGNWDEIGEWRVGIVDMV